MLYGFTYRVFQQQNTVSEPRKPSTYMAPSTSAELYRKTVDVRCEIIGNVAEGYSAGELQICPTETLEIRGQQDGRGCRQLRQGDPGY